MNLNKYNIQKLIEQSNVHIEKKEKDESVIFCILAVIGIIATFMIPTTAKFVALGFAMGAFNISISNYARPAIKRFSASRKLKGVVKELEQSGVYTTKLKLQKANTFTFQSYKEKEENYPFGIRKVQIAVFQDNYGQLKALKQIRSEILRNPHRYVACLRDNIKKARCENIDKMDTEIVKSKEKVKQLLLEKKD